MMELWIILNNHFCVIVIGAWRDGGLEKQSLAQLTQVILLNSVSAYITLKNHIDTQAIPI